ncbi:MAG: glucose-6-phosphate isomerase [Nitrospinae bacterium CG11_big_fil_rev_8_21_14_0_20_45_15]|nr:MAG: glucose-6-phosphate isomerase [Nitrospinae bacterium CG11_big_fil_rev_8_21_14_0_20_45_15]
MNSIELDISNTIPLISPEERLALDDRVKYIHSAMEMRKGVGADFLGWADLPSQTSADYLAEVDAVAKTIRNSCEVLIHLGIGGSYLGARAGISFLGVDGSTKNIPEIHFAGCNISSDYYAELFSVIENKDCCLFLVSKSGATLEFGIGFRLLRQWMEKKYGVKEAARRIFVATDPKEGVLRQLANEKGYFSFDIPSDIGGRYSVLTPVGLIPMAVSGADITALMSGARDMESLLRQNASSENNPAYLYAVNKHLLKTKGKNIEIIAGFHPCLREFLEWQKQLAGESEGKDGKGIFPASVEYPADLHSLGQWVQEGERSLFETFLVIEKSSHEIKIPEFPGDEDGLNFLAGKTLDFVNEMAYKGTAQAHLEGQVPNMTLRVKDRSSYSLGQLFYFFQRAVAMTSYLDKVNPFDQPGVELYKNNMYSLLNKPGY